MDLFFIFRFCYDWQRINNLGQTVEVTIQFRKKGTWSGKFDACQCCGTKKKKHFAKGLCQGCYARAYRDVVKIRKDQKVKDANNN